MPIFQHAVRRFRSGGSVQHSALIHFAGSPGSIRMSLHKSSSGQRKRPDKGPFRLQVDRQTKESYATYEDAEAAGLAIKNGHPIVQVAVYDTLKGAHKIIELPHTEKAQELAHARVQ